MVAKKYPFSDSELSDMLYDLLNKEIVHLLEVKQPNEVNKTNKIKYCRYYIMINHNIEDCVTLKEPIMKFVVDGRILSDNDETVEADHATITTCSDPLYKPHERMGNKIQFDSLLQ